MKTRLDPSAICLSIDALRERLLAEHDPSEHVYRGQTQRYPPHWFRSSSGSADRPRGIEVLYPSDFRFIRQHDLGSIALTDEVTRVRSVGRRIRDDFTAHLFSLTLDDECNARDEHSWISPFADELRGMYARVQREIEDPGLSDTAIVRQMNALGMSPYSCQIYQVAWSLAQHYRVATSLLDVTFSVDVALWFASNHWEVARIAPSNGQGAVYRFNRRRTVEAMLEYHAESCKNARLRGDVAPPRPFITDIRCIPATFAARPSRQCGGSVYGLDAPLAIELCVAHEAVDLFLFQHQPARPGVGITRAHVQPSDDPFLGVVANWS